MPDVSKKLPEDSDDDDLSDFTSVTNRCPVDSTTDSKGIEKTVEKRNKGKKNR